VCAAPAAGALGALLRVRARTVLTGQYFDAVDRNSSGLARCCEPFFTIQSVEGGGNPDRESRGHSRKINDQDSALSP
jgi:hypothetical protein